MGSFLKCFIIYHLLIHVAGPKHSDLIMWEKTKCMKSIQSCPLPCIARFLGFVFTGRIHLSQVTVLFLSAISAISLIYPSSDLAQGIMLADQGTCICRTQVRRLRSLDLKPRLHPKRFYMCNWKPWDPRHRSAPRSGGTSE